jgi:hypothetical protein
MTFYSLFKRRPIYFSVICPPGSQLTSDRESCLTVQSVNPPSKSSKELCYNIGAHLLTYTNKEKLTSTLSTSIQQLVRLLALLNLRFSNFMLVRFNACSTQTIHKIEITKKVTSIWSYVHAHSLTFTII